MLASEIKNFQLLTRWSNMRQRASARQSDSSIEKRVIVLF